MALLPKNDGMNPHAYTMLDRPKPMPRTVSYGSYGHTHGLPPPALIVLPLQCTFPLMFQLVFPLLLGMLLPKPMRPLRLALNMHLQLLLLTLLGSPLFTWIAPLLLHLSPLDPIWRL
jgi:hypothetical protein